MEQQEEADETVKQAIGPPVTEQDMPRGQEVRKDVALETLEDDISRDQQTAGLGTSRDELVTPVTLLQVNNGVNRSSEI